MRIEFTRTGGVAGARISRNLDTDAMSAEEARELAELVESTGFFGLPEVLRAGGADRFQYKIAIEKEGKAHTVQADEGAAPELAPLIARLMAAARGR